ncbi:hypothetical protein Dacet_1385 [Denitrovibrio acetiphilus DSM 12809]|uniref:Uncharacterized protein n=1 Tax=Denitrovibrio acetiphilus (strain DSM 12809 / NBRC 114555 / N2460) TaxID=522772 RepID=D4H806_DENA2|nr:hypothetical protein [Denitrovibrio acetiphilus]ADD68155.1 hypothetical protein Dacet_1385 [Denitrovibrio acetiphilus DSM 12809]
MSITKFQVASVNSGDTKTIDLGTSIINASVAVQGYTVSFGNTDHHVKTLDVQTSLSGISGSSVTVAATCTMEDNSNHKAYGKVDVLVIAECDS